MWVCGLDWAGPGQGQVADACECGNEPSGSLKKRVASNVPIVAIDVKTSGPLQYSQFIKNE